MLSNEIKRLKMEKKKFENLKKKKKILKLDTYRPITHHNFGESRVRPTPPGSRAATDLLSIWIIKSKYH